MCIGNLEQMAECELCKVGTVFACELSALPRQSIDVQGHCRLPDSVMWQVSQRKKEGIANVIHVTIRGLLARGVG